MASEPTLSTLASLASAQLANENISEAESSSFAQAKTKEQARRHYVRTLHKVIDQSDIVVLVLDARDPEGCRSRLVEEEVRRREAEGKKLVFVLNKIGEVLPASFAQEVVLMFCFYGQISYPETTPKRGSGIFVTPRQHSLSVPPPTHNGQTFPPPPHLPYFVYSKHTNPPQSAALQLESSATRTSEKAV